MAHPRLQELIDFTPPWMSTNIAAIRERIIPQIPVSDIQHLDYFESSLSALVYYAVTKDKQCKNFSINIAFYVPDFNEQEVDEEQLWGRDNIWVKIRIKGGVGKYFRSRYMATQLGVARVDWKRKTFRSLKVNSVKAATTTTMSRIGILRKNGFVEEGEDLGRDAGKEDWGELANEQAETIDEISENVTGAPVSPTLYSRKRTKEEMRKLLTAVTASDLETIYQGNGLKELINKAFNCLAHEETRTIARSEFILFWHLFLHEPVGEAVQLCEELGDEDVDIGWKEFAELFKIMIHKFTMRRPLVPVLSAKPNKARALILEFLMKSGSEMQFLLASEPDFDHFAEKVFQTVDERGTSVWNKSDFMHFFCAVLDVPVDIAFEAFKKASDSHQAIAFPNFKFYLKYFLELRPRNAETLCLWTWIVNDWMTNKTEDGLNQLQTNLTTLVTKLCETVHAADQGLNYDQYKLLQTSRAQALYQLPNNEEQETQRFQSLTGSGILTKEQYSTEVLSAIQSVKEMKDDWAFSWAMTDAIGRLEASANYDTLARFFWHYQSRFANGDEMNYTNCWRRNRSLYIADLTPIISMRNDDTFQRLSKQVKLSVETHQRGRREDAECPGKRFFLKISQQPREGLVSLVWESYRLLAIAHFVYLAVSPYRPEHDFATFMTYGRYMGEVFRVEEQYVTNLFYSFGSQAGLMTEDGLAVCLKQVIKKFVRQL